jgi:hypothetical protein
MQGPGQGWWDTQPADRQCLSQPFTDAAGSTRVGAVQLSRQRLQVGLGDQRVGIAVGGPQPLGHRVGQPVGDIAELMQLAALDHWVVEHIQHRAAQRLGAVDHRQDRSGGLQPALPQPDQHLGDHAGVLGGALGQGERDLGAVDGDPSATTQQCSATRMPSTIRATRSRADRSAASSSARACSVRATNRRETADFEVPELACSTLLPTGSSPTR